MMKELLKQEYSISVSVFIAFACSVSLKYITKNLKVKSIK